MDSVLYSRRTLLLSRVTAGRRVAILCVLTCLLLAGCGGSGTAPTGPETTSAAPAAPPTASIAAPAAAKDPAADSVEAIMAEITQLRVLPSAIVEVSYETGQKQQQAERPLTPDEAAAEQTRRMERIVNLAGIVIKRVHGDPEQEKIFNNAVHYLGDARVRLALLGDAEQARLLSDDADTLYEHGKDSFAAVETGFKLVELAEAMAAQHGPQNNEWVKAYAIQARLFAERFPQEQGRVAVSLISAGRKCEQFALHEDARQCFFLVERMYPDSPYAQQLAGILRRLRIVGQPLELAGATIDGGFLSADQFRGKPLLVVYWASNSETLRRDLPALKKLTDRFGPDQMTVIGVNMDLDEYAVDAFLEETGLGWRQIFFAEADKRGGKSPVARYYGIHAVPTYWVVDARGIVVTAPATVAELEARFAQLIRP